MKQSCSEDCTGCYICCCDDIDDVKCECGDNAQPRHSCPYREEIRDDWETLCNCCDSCTRECAMDV